MLTMTCAPACACARVGSPGNQMSSQMFTPTPTPATVYSGHAAAALDPRLQRLQVIAHERGAQQKVLRRVSGDGQLREGDDVHPQLAGAAHVLENPGDVAIQVADGGVDLGQADTESTHEVDLVYSLHYNAITPLRGASIRGHCPLSAVRCPLLALPPSPFPL